MVDIQGGWRPTRKECIPEAGHFIGNGFACQANLMFKSTVWNAMAKAFESTPESWLTGSWPRSRRRKGRRRYPGKQSAAILVVKGKSSGAWWKDRIYDLRVEDDRLRLSSSSG